MTSEAAAPDVSDHRTSPAPSARPAREDRIAPLNFWFGPKKIGAAKFFMTVENLPIDPTGSDLPPPPNLAEVDARIDGIYRPSEPLSPDTPILGSTNTHIRYIESSFDRRFIDMTTSFDDYMSRFSGKTRSTIKRKVRKFEAASGGAIEWSSYRSAAEMDQFHALARDISKLTYQEKLFDAGIPDDGDFIAEMHDLAAADSVRGYILFFKNKPISYLYLPVRQGRVIYGHLGFDPAFGKHSPGTVLQLLALEHLFSEGKYRLFDFTEGEGPHKRLFSTLERYCGNVFYLRPTFKNRCILRLHLAVRGLSDLTDTLVVKSGLKERLRRALRGQSRAT